MTNSSALQQTTVFVVHIPKTAGTTLRVIAERQYMSGELYKIKDPISEYRSSLGEMSVEEQYQLRAVFGHMCFGWHEELKSPQPFTYTTFLRNPTERLISLWWHVSRAPRGHYLGTAARGMGLYELAKSGLTCTTDNGMVRQLCGEDAFYQKPGADMAIPFGKVSEVHLELAQSNLDKYFSHVGFAETFDTSVRQLGRMLAWRIPRYENKNVGRNRPHRRNLLNYHGNKLKPYIELDTALYDYAWGRYGHKESAHSMRDTPPARIHTY